MPKILDETETKNLLSKLVGWTRVDNSIVKEYKFANFNLAISFIVSVGIESEKMDHHPDIFLHSWNKVKITLSTHSAGGLTTNDFTLAEKLDLL